MCPAYEGSYVDLKFRNSCDFVLFTESELAEIASNDLKEGRHWRTPNPMSPTLEELCDQLWGAAVVVELTSTEPTSTEAPEAVEPILIEGSPRAPEEDASAPRAREEGALAEARPPSTEAPLVF